MTLWIDDGSNEGFLANCGNCVFAIEDPTQNLLICGWDPPVALVPPATGSWGDASFSVTTWEQPLVQRDMHCHHHPKVQQARDFGRGWQKGLRRPEDRENRGGREA